MKLSEYEEEFKANPSIKRDYLITQLFLAANYVLWIASILILLYQTSVSSFGNQLTSIWGATLIAAILAGLIGKSMKRKLILRAEKQREEN